MNKTVRFKVVHHSIGLDLAFRRLYSPLEVAMLKIMDFGEYGYT
jgi:hypothetical protein